jgi:hypothetical protein
MMELLEWEFLHCILHQYVVHFPVFHYYHLLAETLHHHIPVDIYIIFLLRFFINALGYALF